MNILNDIIGFFENFNAVKDDVTSSVTDAAQGALDTKDAVIDSIPEVTKDGIDIQK